MCVPERTLQDQVTGHHDNDDMYMTFATHVFNSRLAEGTMPHMAYNQQGQYVKPVGPICKTSRAYWHGTG
jgi:hypothetical protein